MGDINDRRADAGLNPLTDEQIMSAGLTYLPSGEHDPYIMFASGGHSGQMYVIGVPSMRLLKSIGVFTPEPWQGWGYGNLGTEEVLDGGDINGEPVTWADTHHPALSETAGDYDGEFVFINDKANARVAVIDLRDFETKQIIKNPIAINDHGGTMVTPDTEWVIEGGQYAAPLGWEYAPISEYETEYKGMVTLWKFDRAAGRIDESRSFALELPPYWQDLCDAGKLVSTSPGPSLLNCLRTGRTFAMQGSLSPQAGSSATRSTPSSQPDQVPTEAASPSKLGHLHATTTTCMPSTLTRSRHSQRRATRST
jgi:nitrous-oxide reductase